MQRGLGKGLEQILPKSQASLLQIPLASIQESKSQPREVVAQESLEELILSIRQHGLLQPVLVRRTDDHFELISGHRRVAAARSCGLQKVPAHVVEADDQKVLLFQLIENMQREDLNPLEEAKGIEELMGKWHLTQEKVAKLLGKSRSEIANTLRLASAPASIQTALRSGRLTKSHARTLLSMPEALRERALQQVLSGKIPVRALEQQSRTSRKKKVSTKDVHLRALENALEERLGARVRVARQRRGYRLTIEVYSNEELEGLLAELKVSPDLV